MNGRLAKIPRSSRRDRVAAYYQRRGFLTGTGTLVDDLMQRLGLVNFASRLDEPLLARASLEEMALARPDFLIVMTGSSEVQDRGTEMLQHPLLGGVPRVEIPQAWTVCGAPAYVRAAESHARRLQSESVSWR